MSPVKWGIISTAKIGTEKVIPGMLKSKDLGVVAIASRDLKTAQAAAKKLGIPKAYGSYEELLAELLPLLEEEGYDQVPQLEGKAARKQKQIFS